MTLALIRFIATWNGFLWPLLITRDEALRTLPLALSFFSGYYGTQYHLLAAAACVSVAPLLILFLVLQRQVVEGVALARPEGLSRTAPAGRGRGRQRTAERAGEIRNSAISWTMRLRQTRAAGAYRCMIKRSIRLGCTRPQHPLQPDDRRSGRSVLSPSETDPSGAWHSL